MTGRIDRAVAIDGALAFQDRENPELFHYLPLDVPAVLGDTLESFSCQYYGIGPKPQWVQTGPSTYASIVGAAVQGRARFDASTSQQRRLRQAIRRRFQLAQPQLVPIGLEDTHIEPVVSSAPSSSTTFELPRSVWIGRPFDFVADSNNSLFAELVARFQRHPEQKDSAVLGMRLQGTAELFAEPLQGRIQSDLADFWRLLRHRAPEGERIGWYPLEDDPLDLLRELLKQGVLHLDAEGRRHGDLGLQGALILRQVFDALNTRITSGELWCRLGANPRGRSKRGAPSPWTVEVNLAAPASALGQSVLYDAKVAFQGKTAVPFHSYMELSVACSPRTHRMFYDVTAGKTECITLAKVEALQERIRREIQAKEAKIEEYERRLLSGEIDLATFEALVALLNTRTLTEHPPGSACEEAAMLAQVEASARRRAAPRQVHPS